MSMPPPQIRCVEQLGRTARQETLRKKHWANPLCRTNRQNRSARNARQIRSVEQLGTTRPNCSANQLGKCAQQNTSEEALGKNHSENPLCGTL